MRVEKREERAEKRDRFRLKMIKFRRFLPACFGYGIYIRICVIDRDEAKAPKSYKKGIALTPSMAKIVGQNS